MNWAEELANRISQTFSKKAVDIIKKAHEEETRFFVRNNILLGLGLTTDPSCIDIISEVITDKKEAALRRCYATIGAGFINDQRLSDILKKIVTDKDDKEVKASACIALGNLKDKTAIPILGKILNTPQGVKKELPQIRAFAALGLGRIGGKEALAELKKCTPASEREIMVRSAVAVALGTTGVPEAKEPILIYLRDRHPTIKGLAALSLGLIKAPKTYEIITAAYKKNRLNAPQGLMLLGLALSENDKAKADLRKILENKKSRALLKSSAAIGLGLMKDTKAVPIIIKMLENEKQQRDVILTPYLILSLGMIQDAKGAEILEKIWAKADKDLTIVAYSNLAVALTMLGKRKEVLEQLATHTAGKDNQISSYALHTLGLVGDRESAKIFVETYRSNDNFDVRRAVVDGIGFLLNKNSINPLERVTGNNIDMQLIIMDHILPIPVW